MTVPKSWNKVQLHMHEMWAALQCEVYSHAHVQLYHWSWHKRLTLQSYKSLSSLYLKQSTFMGNCLLLHHTHNDQNVAIHNASLMFYYLIVWNYICIMIGSYLSIPVIAVISGLHANKVEGPILLCIDHFALFVCIF